MANDFAASIARFSDTTCEELDDKITGIAEELFTGIIVATPILTGRLVNNWMPDVNGYNFDSNATPKTTRLPALKRVKSVLKPGTFLKKDGFVTLCNSTPYGRRIEYLGYSRRKAPEGMVRITLSKLRAKYGG